MARERPLRGAYRHFQPISTRWHDNDLYGHVNNVIYYSYFDSAVNTWLIEHAGLDVHSDPVVAYVAGSACDYYASVAFPQRIEVGIAIDKLGNSSVQYALAVFVEGQPQACAAGRFTHVFVDRRDHRPVPIPAKLRSAFERLLPA
ncbi:MULTISPECIES: thioesterase family protein [Pseudomonas]|uniref:Acyl-CoA thioesterase n=1 Tax=Pseudomonas taiwanensis TaxID=470150 RepID=A0ABR6V9Q5_9PSED|nr:thioesterase family protein [Pseudomonas taiwanensis]MBC3477228.1 acyl-CoA thioesterase [Pseudomonas taiwanensis]MBC3491725.1 acyl-CoA thioesterase [Pseudomonas taiwanensis]